MAGRLISNRLRGYPEKLVPPQAAELQTMEDCSRAEKFPIIGPAAGPFDLVFNDINKECYPESLPVITRKLRPGGVLMVDNMFWYGRVFDQADRSPSIQGVRELTPRLKDDLGWNVCVVPIGDEQAVAYER